MELLPLGPVLFIDTAGIDDVGALGEMRVKKTRQVFDRTDLGLMVAEAGQWGEFEEGILGELRERKTPGHRRLQQVRSRAASRRWSGELRGAQDPARRNRRQRTARGVLDLREALLDAAPEDFLDTRDRRPTWCRRARWPCSSCRSTWKRRKAG